MQAVHLPQPSPHAISDVSCPGPVHLHRCTGGWLQSVDRDPAQAVRHALERIRRQQHHRSPLFQTQWTLRGFLGTPLISPQSGRVTSPHKSGVHPNHPMMSSILAPASIFSKIAETGMRVPLSTHAPLTLPGMLSTTGHWDQSRLAMLLPSLHRSLLPRLAKRLPTCPALPPSPSPHRPPTNTFSSDRTPNSGK